MKILLFILAAFALLATAALFGMPGMRDGERHLAGDYYFTYSGGAQTSISEERDGVSGFVITDKVEEFHVEGNGLFVTRRPLLREEVETNRWNERLSDTCEYYRIDIAQRKVHGPFALDDVKNRTEWAFLKERPLNKDFGKTLCKLDAVRN